LKSIKLHGSIFQVIVVADLLLVKVKGGKQMKISETIEIKRTVKTTKTKETDTLEDTLEIKKTIKIVRNKKVAKRKAFDNTIAVKFVFNVSMLCAITSSCLSDRTGGQKADIPSCTKCRSFYIPTCTTDKSIEHKPVHDTEYNYKRPSVHIPSMELPSDFPFGAPYCEPICIIDDVEYEDDYDPIDIVPINFDNDIEHEFDCSYTSLDNAPITFLTTSTHYDDEPTNTSQKNSNEHTYNEKSKCDLGISLMPKFINDTISSNILPPRAPLCVGAR